VHIAFSFDASDVNKGMAGSIVAVAAGVLLGVPILGIIAAGLFMKFSRDKKREEAKQAIIQKLRGEVFPQVLRDVSAGIEKTINDNIAKVNTSIEEELTNQRTTLEKAMSDLRIRINDEKEKKENLAADINADLERIEEIKNGLR
jgi:deoxyinosine 3'endonuclease (endonuclease V)